MKPMKLIKQSGPDCLTTSAAMVFDTTVEDIHAYIGTDGHERVFNGIGTRAMRGVHIREIQEYAWDKCGSVLTPIDVNPRVTPIDTSQPPYIIWSSDESVSKLAKWLGLRAIVLGYCTNGESHACAWDGNNLYDPKGKEHKIPNEEFTPQQFWAVIPVINLNRY